MKRAVITGLDIKSSTGNTRQEMTASFKSVVIPIAGKILIRRKQTSNPCQRDRI